MLRRRIWSEQLEPRHAGHATSLMPDPVVALERDERLAREPQALTS